MNLKKKQKKEMIYINVLKCNIQSNALTVNENWTQ